MSQEHDRRAGQLGILVPFYSSGDAVGEVEIHVRDGALASNVTSTDPSELG